MLSCVALRLACMCGSATFAIVVSSTCNSTAIITPIVTMIRSPAGSGCDATFAGVSAILLVEVDRHRGGKSGDQRLARVAVERDPNGHALSHLDPIAVGILGRNDGEFAARACADALDVSLEVHAGIGVDFDLGLLSGHHFADVLLFKVRLD